RHAVDHVEDRRRRALVRRRASTEEVEVTRRRSARRFEAEAVRGADCDVEHAALDERWLARGAAKIAHVVGVAWRAHDVTEEILVAERAEPAEDVLRFEDVEAGAERHGER